MSPNTVFRRSVPVTAAVLAVVGVSACSSTTSGAPETTTQAPTSSNTAAPQLENPKNVKAVTDVCQILTPQQLTQLGAATSGEKETTMYGEPKCTWTNDNFSATVALNTTTGFGPAKIREKGRAKNTLTQVSGYPAMHVDAQSSLCRVEVGLNKGQSIAVNYAVNSGDAPAMQDPCAYAEKIAAAAIENIPDA